MMESIESKKEKREQKKHKRFINRIVNDSIMHSKKTYDQTGSKAVRLPCKKVEWSKIRSNLPEINRILETQNVKIEVDNPNLSLYEIRIVKLD